MDGPADLLAEEVVREIRGYWSEAAEPMPLSLLGSFEQGRISQEAKRHAVTLRLFLEQYAGGAVRVVEHTKNPTVVGVVPRDEPAEAIPDWIEKSGGNATQQWLHPALWAAFRKPLGEGSTRYIEAGPPVRFTDVEEGAAAADGIEVQRRFVVGPDDSAGAVYEKAMAWLRDNGFSASDFRPSTESKADAALPSSDLLGRLILALDARDLEKMSIPMEVVAKLRRVAI